MSLGQQHSAALRQYQEAHPEVDWDNNTYVCSLNRDDLTLTVTGHRPLTDADRESFARLKECCVPDCPTHREDR